MLDFDDTRLTFRVKGQDYYLLPLSFGDVPEVGSALEVEGLKSQADILVDVLAKKARCDKAAWRLKLARKMSPADAVRSLGVKQQARLFGDWLGDLHGVVPGE